ncbi:MAG: HEAT repeat domain-containing protein [Chloroflexi bacterium]|nr:HEAT repeat domain-containing protein [Chloroflexota bacterium]
MATRVVALMAPDARRHVSVAPDPSDGEGARSAEDDVRPLPYASFVMRQLIHLLRLTDLVVSVEGWMIHAAYLLGKRYRVLMQPESHDAAWQPLLHTLEQGVFSPRRAATLMPTPSWDEGPPLPDQPRRFALTMALSTLGSTGDRQALPVLHWALRSEDGSIRTRAAEALAHMPGEEIHSTLSGLLADPVASVRAAAAAGLLERASSGAQTPEIDQVTLRAYVALGAGARDWTAVLRLGPLARPALRAAVSDEDDVIRREARAMLDHLDRMSSARAGHIGSASQRDAAQNG